MEIMFTKSKGRKVGIYQPSEWDRPTIHFLDNVCHFCRYEKECKLQCVEYLNKGEKE